jgi:hypothetical protein
MALLCLVGLLAGWSVGRRVPLRSSRDKLIYPYTYLALFGIFFLLLGAAGNYSVTRAQGEGTLNYHAASAYWYLLFYVGYPGLAIAVWALLKMKSPVRFVLWAVNVAALLAFIMPQVINARRGPLFPAILILLVVPPLTLRRPPSRLVYCGGLVALAVVMLLFLQIRQTIYNGGTWGDAFQKLDVSSAVVDRGEDADDNEYVNSSQLIGTLYQNGKCDYGTGHLELLVHWVPRALWPDKPALGDGSYSNDQLFDDVERATGVHLLGASGASAAGVADSFLQYGTFCPVFWFVLGFVIALVYNKVLYTCSPWWMFSYVGILCASHWQISQSFTAAFVPGMYFQAVPLVVMAGLWLHRGCFPPRAAARPRPRPLPRVSAPQALTP